MSTANRSGRVRHRWYRRTTSYQYDAASNLTERTDGRGLVTKYFPDSLRRLDLIEYWTSGVLTNSVDYTYNAVGFRTQMVDSTGTTTYTPDALNRLASVTFPGPKTVSYTYDDLPGGSVADYPGQRTVVTYPDSKTATYTYLPNGAMSTVTDWLTKQTAYTYNDVGMLTKTQLPNTAWTDYGYDNADRLTSAVNKKTGPVTLSSFTYTLDATGSRTQLVDLAGTHSYQYDQLYRLTQVTYPGPQTDTYTYDGVGNRLTMNAASYTYDAADQMLTVGAVSYGYDNNGNQTTRGTDTFTYDHENRLTQTVISSATSSSVYNGDGMRMSHTVSGTPTNYTWDVNASLPVVLQDGTNTYVYGLDLISATDGGGAQTYFTYDGLGSTTDLTDGSGTVTGTYSYDVFGVVRAQTGGGANQWQFTGEQRDADSGLYFLRARYYDPASGRFLGQDPAPRVLSRPSANGSYSYVANNPTSWVDPSGLWCPKDPSDCDPRGAIDPLIDLLPEGTLIELGPYHISLQVSATCLLYPEACAAAVTAFAITNALAYSTYSSTELNEGTRDIPKEGDAFQHCFWSGLITLTIGASLAEDVTTRYEAWGEGNIAAERAYDLDNNQRGREFAETLRYFGGPSASNTLLLQQHCSGGRVPFASFLE